MNNWFGVNQGNLWLKHSLSVPLLVWKLTYVYSYVHKVISETWPSGVQRANHDHILFRMKTLFGWSAWISRRSCSNRKSGKDRGKSRYSETQTFTGDNPLSSSTEAPDSEMYCGGGSHCLLLFDSCWMTRWTPNGRVIAAAACLNWREFSRQSSRVEREVGRVVLWALWTHNAFDGRLLHCPVVLFIPLKTSEDNGTTALLHMPRISIRWRINRSERMKRLHRVIEILSRKRYILWIIFEGEFFHAIFSTFVVKN